MPGVRFLCALLPALSSGALYAQPSRGATEEGVALAIVFDTSGSMKDPVPSGPGQSAPKYTVANRALRAVVDRLDQFVQHAAPGTARKLRAGLIVFRNGHAHEAIQFGDFEAAKFRRWADTFRSPNGSTPLGDSATLAAQKVLAAKLTRNHVLIVTDGMNTAGPDLAAVLPGLKQQAEQRQTTLTFHLVAFDVDAKLFDPVKKLGATVVNAADAQQLNDQLQFILERKILLEDEEPPAARSKPKP